MHGHSYIWFGIFQYAIGNHGDRPAQSFFTRLKNKFECSSNVFLVAGHDFGQAQTHGGMPIMPAGMHDACVLGGEGKTGFFFNGEGVHVKAEENRGTIFGSFQ